MAAKKPKKPAPKKKKSAAPDILNIVLDEACPVRVADSAGNILYANALYRSQIEGAHEIGVGLELTEIIHQLEVLHCPITQELKIERDGQAFSYRVRHSLREEKTPLIVSVYTDASIEEQVKSRLVLTQGRLDDLIRLTSDWTWETDAAMRLTTTSHRIFELLGIHPREFLGKNIFTLGEGEGVTLHSESGLPLAVSQLRPFRDLVFSIKARGGKVHSFKFNGIPHFDAKTGAFLGYRGTASDITDAREAQRRAQLLEKRLSNAIENMSEGFSLFDKDNKLILVNEKFRNFYPATASMLQPGIDKLDWLRQSVLLNDIDIGDLSADEWIKRRLTIWHRHGGSMEMRLGDGRYISVRDYKTDDGGTVSIRTDITEMKEREQALIEARYVAEEANKAKGEFFAKMSHELRTPLNAIIGFSDLMKSEQGATLLPEQIQAYSQDINDSASHLLNIINDILEVSRAEAGKLELIEQNVSVMSAMQSTVRMLAEHALRSGVRLDITGVDANIVLRADQKKIRQILINLFSNAIKFTLSGGSVSGLAYIDQSGNAVIMVRDTGIGMRPEDIPRALTPFAQVSNALGQKHEGTGLGLPLCVALAELHGGSLKVDSALGQGTAVSVLFPAERIVKSASVSAAE